MPPKTLKTHGTRVGQVKGTRLIHETKGIQRALGLGMKLGKGMKVLGLGMKLGKAT